MSHLVIDTGEKVGLDFITLECSENDRHSIDYFLRKKFDLDCGITLIGKRVGKTIQIFNDRDLAPIYIGRLEGIELVSENLSLIYGMANYETGLSFRIYASEELHSEPKFGLVKSDLGFKMLSNSLVMFLGDVRKKGDYISSNGKKFLVNSDLGNRIKGGEKIIGRLSDSRCKFDVQILGIVE